VGGILLAPLLILIVLPVLIRRFARRQYPRIATEAPASPDDAVAAGPDGGAS